MLTTEALKDLIETYAKKTVPGFHNTDSNDTFPLDADAAFTFSYIAKNIDSLNEKELRLFLRSRNALLPGVYLRNPLLPVNQFCIRLGELIAREDEAVCQIVMPLLKGLTRKSSSLKSETENEGHLSFEPFLLNHNKNRLIPVAELFHRAAINTDLVFKDFQAQQHEFAYELTEHDFIHIAEVTGEAGAAYLKALKKHHAQRHDNKSIGFAIKVLANEVRKGSAAETGNEDTANLSVIDDAIKNFYDLWKTVPKNIKRKVCAYRLENFGIAGLSLKSYFLALFVRNLDCVLTKGERRKQKREDIYPCAFQISECLDEFLSQHSVLFQIMITADSTPIELPPLEPLQQNALEALSIRHQEFGVADNHFYYQLVKHMRSLEPLTQETFVDLAALLAPSITKYAHLIRLNGCAGLFKEVIKLMGDRLLCLDDLSEIHLLFPHLSSEQQKSIIDARWDEIKPHYLQYHQYSALEKSVTESIKQAIRTLYFQSIVNRINSPGDLIALGLDISNIAFMNELWALLITKFLSLVRTYDDVFELFDHLSSSAIQIQLIDFIFNKFPLWLNPESYDSLCARSLESAAF